MDKSDFLRMAFHNPAVMMQALNVFPYRSPIRAAVESELATIAERAPKTVEQLFRNPKPDDQLPKFTVETFAAAARACCTRRTPGSGRYNIDTLVLWWKQHIGSFSDEQAPMVEQMVDSMDKLFYAFTFVFPLLTLVPETDAFDRVRAAIRGIFLKEFARIRKLQSSVLLALGQFRCVDLTGSFDVTGKAFKTVMLDDDTCAKIKAMGAPALSPYARESYACGLMFALRTEAEFLDYWKHSTDAWRVSLSQMHGKISPKLLHEFLTKYSRNDRIIDELVQHPAMPADRLMFYALRGNFLAKLKLEERVRGNQP